jgi:heme o synthase
MEASDMSVPVAASLTLSRTAKQYYVLAKPGIVYSNVLTAAAGFLLASRWHGNLTLLGTLLGATAGVIAASCVANNYVDRHIDARMTRTCKRPLVTGAISVRGALLFGLVMSAAGFYLLWQINAITFIVGCIAAFSYVVLYGIAKRLSVHGTLVGTIPGAASLVAGYTTVTGHLDMAALLLFMAMVCWQMAHFYAITIFRRSDYAAAGLPVRSVAHGVMNTKRQLIVYAVGFLLISPLVVRAVDGEGRAYAFVMAGVGLWWLYRLLVQRSINEVRWARRAFGASLVVLLCFCAMLAAGTLLP